MKRVGNLKLVKSDAIYVQEWFVYDEDNEYQGVFIGNPDKVTEREIWEQL